MDSIRCILRPGLWLYCLLCVLPVANASTTVPVQVPSAHETVKNSSGVSTSGDKLKVNGPLQGEYIPREGTGTRVSVKVKPSVDFSIPRTINAIKPLVRGGFIPALATAGVTWAIHQLPGANFDPVTGDLLKTPSATTTKEYWYPNYRSGQQFWSSSALTTCILSTSSTTPSQYAVYKSGTYSPLTGSETTAGCHRKPQGADNFIYEGELSRSTKNCPNGFQGDTYNCNSSSPELVPFTESDYQFVESQLDTIVDPEWLREILLTSCSQAPNPETCADDLKEYQNDLIGPATVPGGTTTTTSTYVKPDGTVGTKESVTTNNYRISYGPTSFTFNKSSTTTYKENGEVTGTETTEEEGPPDSEPEPAEQEEPVPCTANCDGPAYDDLYQPTDMTKEAELDSYSSRIASIPILVALGDYFSVSVPGTSCPVWSYSGTLDIFGESMPINLQFDHHCLPWFVDLKPYIQIIVIFMFTMLAVRVGLL